MAWTWLRRGARRFLSATLLREGAIRTILRGPSRGLRYRVFSDYGLSPLYGGWESHAQRLMVKHIYPGSVAYDIGANHGVHTLLMARLVGTRGHVYAFEPVPDILGRLQENVMLNDFSNVTCVELALGDYVGHARFSTARNGATGHVTETNSTDGEDLRVGITTLDDFVLGENHRPPDFIKLDVEGFESKVLSGGERILQLYRPTLLVELHNPAEDIAVGRILRGLEYEAFRTEDGGKIRDLTKGWPDPDGLWGHFIAFSAE